MRDIVQLIRNLEQARAFVSDAADAGLLDVESKQAAHRSIDRAIVNAYTSLGESAYKKAVEKQAAP